MTKSMITKVGIGIAGAVLLIGTALGIRKATKKEYVKVDTPSDEETGKEEQQEEKAEG